MVGSENGDERRWGSVWGVFTFLVLEVHTISLNVVL